MDELRALSCNGVGRDNDCISALRFFFNRPVSDDEMRFLHDVMRRSVALAEFATRKEPQK